MNYLFGNSPYLHCLARLYFWNDRSVYLYKTTYNYFYGIYYSLDSYPNFPLEAHFSKLIHKFYLQDS